MKIRPPSINVYVGLFLAVTAVLFLMLGRWTVDEMDIAPERIRDAQRGEARAELEQAVTLSADELIQLGQTLAQWDELRQQLENPTYYAYWRNHRLLASGRLPPSFDNAEVYAADGQALARLMGTGMPQQLTELGDSEQLHIEGDPAYLHGVVPVTRKNGELMGYVAVRGELMPLLLQGSRFHTLDEATLTLDIPADRRSQIDEVVDAFDFELLANPAALAVQGVLQRAGSRVAVVVVVTAAALYLMLMLLMGRPLRALSEHIDRMGTDEGKVLLERSGYSLPVRELEKVRESLNHYKEQLSEADSRLDEQNRQLWSMAHHDPLTGVANRRAFDDMWQQTSELLANSRTTACLILFDCNSFKTINDTYGHQVGDAVLKALAGCLTRALRDGEHLYRLGGDEFGAIMLNCSTEAAEAVAGRCLESVEAHDFSVLGVSEPVRVAIGIAHTDSLEVENLARLQTQADIAMYRAKRPGGGVVTYRPEMASDSESLFSNWATSAVFEAIKDGTGIQMHYQPIVDLQTRQPSYYEALLRIRRDDEMLPPSSIFPVIEAKRLDREMDVAIINAIAADLAAGLVPRGTGVSINLSGQSVVYQDLVGMLEPVMGFTQHYYMVLEITETSLITQLEQARENLARLRSLGFRIALDDFGSGYSSLRYLGNMPVDVVKFDITMVRDIGGSGSQRTMVEGLARLIIDAGYHLVAEGIEDEALAERVRGIGFGHGQGWLFGRPAHQIPAKRGAA